ncbi:hypothetical protein LSAT2_019688, partial [Lamellibrachia satsuma]
VGYAVSTVGSRNGVRRQYGCVRGWGTPSVQLCPGVGYAVSTVGSGGWGTPSVRLGPGVGYVVSTDGSGGWGTPLVRLGPRLGYAVSTVGSGGCGVPCQYGDRFIGSQRVYGPKGDSTTLYTPARFGYGSFWLHVAGRTTIVYRVKACSDVHVIIAEQTKDLTTKATEIVTGAFGNSRAMIRKAVHGPEYVAANISNLLHCGEFRTFWVSWGGKLLRIGRGPTVGQQMFVTVPRTSFSHVINVAGFSTYDGHSGSWTIPENTGSTLTVSTPGIYKYEYVWKTVEQRDGSFAFRVRACSDAYVAFGRETALPGGYEVTFGASSNTKTCVRFWGEEMSCKVHEGLLDCSKYRQLWVSWSGLVITAGQGEMPGQQVLVEYAMHEMNDVGALSFTTARQKSGEWLFEEDLENRFTVITAQDKKSTPSFDAWVFTPRQHFVSFQVKACKEVFLVISKQPGEVDDSSQLVYIGGSDNTKTGIRNIFSPGPLLQVDTPSILDCGVPLSFWLSWHGRHLEFGKGDVYRQQRLLAWKPPGLDFVNAVGFATSAENGAIWTVRRNVGDELYLRTPSTYNHEQLWLTVRGHYFQTFRVRACSDVHVALAQTRGVIDVNSYEVILGYKGTQTVIREQMGIFKFVAKAETPDILSCHSLRSFWVSWIDGYIRVGQGYRYGERTLLTLQQPMPHPVTALSITTNHSTGHWMIDADRGDFVLLTTQEGGGKHKWLQLLPGNNWTYIQVAGSDVNVTLSAHYRDTSMIYVVTLDKQTDIVQLWRDAELLQTANAPNLLDPQELREFWMSWESGRIQFGHGRFRGQRIIIDFVDEKPRDVNAIALSGSKKAEWKLLLDQADELTYETSSILDLDQQLWMTVRHAVSEQFTVTACDNAYVRLSSIRHDVSSRSSYVLRIHDGSNMTSLW